MLNIDWNQWVWCCNIYVGVPLVQHHCIHCTPPISIAPHYRAVNHTIAYNFLLIPDFMTDGFWGAHKGSPVSCHANQWQAYNRYKDFGCAPCRTCPDEESSLTFVLVARIEISNTIDKCELISLHRILSSGKAQMHQLVPICSPTWLQKAQQSSTAIIHSNHPQQSSTAITTLSSVVRHEPIPWIQVKNEWTEQVSGRSGIGPRSFRGCTNKNAFWL
jgi:hypothetical protein